MAERFLDWVCFSTLLCIPQYDIIFSCREMGLSIHWFSKTNFKCIELKLLFLGSTIHAVSLYKFNALFFRHLPFIFLKVIRQTSKFLSLVELTKFPPNYIFIFVKISKGQLISKCIFEKIVWTKIPTKNLIDSAQQV